MDNISVIIVAGGSGTRMGSTIPKQFLTLDSSPILVRTIRQFLKALPQADIIVVLPADQLSYWSSLAHEYGLEGHHRVCIGGATRFHSVQNALELVGGCQYIAVHDAVRPLILPATICAAVECAATYRTAIPVVTPVDSLRLIEGHDLSSPLDRAKVRVVQTPQIFEAELLQQAYKAEFSPHFTDDASVVESSGVAVTLCPGQRTNIKITTAEDLTVAEALIKIIDNQ